MIQSLYIRNYLLIDHLELDFSSGFITLTGETGAGKSILMGALSLILGQRVDTAVLKLKDAKCIVEGTFRPGERVREIFESNDLDFEQITTLRREIAPGGKSRAFINDTPVNLPLLKEVGKLLVDIHSQHQNLRLNDHLYQMEVITHMAGVDKELARYRDTYAGFKEITKELERVGRETTALKEEQEYMQFQYNELQSAHLVEGEMEELEANLQRAEHAEEIRSGLFESAGHLSAETSGILDQLRASLLQLQKIARLYTPSRELATRMESAYIELKDIASEVELEKGKTGLEPGELEKLRERMDLLIGLIQKHRLQELDQLIVLRNQLGSKIEDLTFSDEKVAQLEQERSALLQTLEKQAEFLHKKRSSAANEMQLRVEEQLQQLGIPNARFRVELVKTEVFDANGSDQVRFLFSANKQLSLEEISRVASGGEVSRLMLCIKSMVSDRKGMPTLIFDEIDAGVSGEIADKVGGIMDHLAEGRQVMAITHLPQVASRGAEHFVVYKEDTSDATYTRIRKLQPDERITEIARMLSGEELTEEALSNARVLLR
ncbi:MAG: DNA repair protein RecN, partial [Bacteroidales bacterium]|nr:DNA repair protein RecN [Bacteroidales bacterium]